VAGRRIPIKAQKIRILITLNGLTLHFGLPKTGTSTLQRALLQQHSQVHFLGKHVPSKIPKGCLSTEVYQVLDPLLWHTGGQLNLAKHRSRFEEIMASASSEKCVTVASWEGLANADREKFYRMLERIVDVCGRARLMVSLRDPISWLPSLYLQEVQGHFVKRNRKHYFGNRAFVELKTWLQMHETRHGSISGWLSYLSNIQIAVKMLGKENVQVFLFEDLRSDPESYYRSIAEFLGIEPEECLKLTGSSHLNLRLLQSDMDYIRQVDSIWHERLRWRFSTLKKRRGRLLRQRRSARNQSEPARVELNDEWREKVSNGTREGNRYLADEFGLDLAGYGYPL